MKSLKILSIFLFTVILLTGCSLKKNENVIVKVNGHSITQKAYDELFNQSINNPALQMFGLDKKNLDKKSFMYLIIKDRVVDQLIVRALLEEEIAKRKIVVTKEDTDKELQEKIKQVGSKAKFNELLKQYGVSLAEYKQDLQEEVKLQRLVDSLEKVNVSDNDAKKYYNANISKFKYPEKVRASHILISANPEEIKEIAKADAKNAPTDAELEAIVKKQMDEKLAVAKAVLEDVKKDPSSFAKIAKDKSEDVESAKQGGDLGFFAKQEMVEPFAKAAFSMKPNTISELVKTSYGYHIIMVTDRMEAGQDSFEKVKAEIKLYLENEKKRQVLEDFIGALKKNAKIEYVDEEYNPTDIKEALKQQAKLNSDAAEQVDEANHTATPEAVPEKK